MARYTGAVCRLCRRERMKLFLKGTKCDTMKLPDRAQPVPAGPARPRSHPRQRVPAPAAREAEGPPHLRPAREAVPQPSTPRRTASRASPARTCCACSSCASTTSCSAPASRRAATRRASSCATATCSVNGKRVTIPSYMVRKGDVVELRAKAQKMIVIRHNIDTLDRTVPHVARGRRRPTSRRPCATCRCASRSTSRCASSSSSSSTPSNSPAAVADAPDARGATPCSSSSVPRSRPARPRATSSGSRSRRSSPASATRSATACAARCSRRSPARRSRRCASTTRCTSSTSSRA